MVKNEIVNHSEWRENGEKKNSVGTEKQKKSVAQEAYQKSDISQRRVKA